MRRYGFSGLPAGPKSAADIYARSESFPRDVPQEYEQIIKWDFVTATATAGRLAPARRPATLFGVQTIGAVTVVVGGSNVAVNGPGTALPQNNLIIFFVGAQPPQLSSLALVPGAAQVQYAGVPIPSYVPPRLILDVYNFYVVSTGANSIVSYFWTLPPLIPGG